MLGPQGLALLRAPSHRAEHTSHPAQRRPGRKMHTEQILTTRTTHFTCRFCGVFFSCLSLSDVCRHQRIRERTAVVQCWKQLLAQQCSLAVHAVGPLWDQTETQRDKNREWGAGGAQGQKGKQRNELCCPRGKLALVCYVAAWFKNKGKQKEKKRKLGSVSKDFLQIKNSSLQTSLQSGDAELTADLCSSIRSHMHPCPALHGNHIPPHGPQIPPSPPHPQHGLPSRTAPTCVLVSPSVYFPTNAEGKGIIYKQRGKCLQGGALRKRHQIYYYYYYLN